MQGGSRADPSIGTKISIENYARQGLQYPIAALYFANQFQ
jgi:hypothetical protein